MADKTWKRRERAIAKIFGGKRVGPQGANTEDVTHPLLHISVKSRKTLPAWASQCLAECRAFRGSDGKVPVVIMVGAGQRIGDGLIILRVSDFTEIFGQIQQKEEVPA